MEWVETTGKSVDDAVEAALDMLGVDVDEVEYEVLDEGRSGLFGRREARIRARVKPISREKPNDRRRRGGSGSGSGRSARSGRSGGGNGGRGGGQRRDRGERKTAVAVADDDADAPARSPRRRGGRGRGGGGGGGGRGGGGGGGERQSGDRAKSNEQREDRSVTEEDVPVEEQAAAAEDFTKGLVEAFGADGEVVTTVDDDGVLIEVQGGDLGLLVGPKGATLQAIEELVRTVVQRRTEGHGTRINVDVAGYRAKRRAALTEFANELAEKVKESGKDLALEPMSAADRKVVHDAIAELDGVSTVSEGEEPRRRVVLRSA